MTAVTPSGYDFGSGRAGVPWSDNAALGLAYGAAFGTAKAGGAIEFTHSTDFDNFELTVGPAVGAGIYGQAQAEVTIFSFRRWAGRCDR